MRLKKIKELFSFEKGVLQSSKCIEGEYNFLTAAADRKTHNEYTHDCEALVFAAAASGSLGRTHYINGKFISSDLCFIITPKDQEKLPIDLKFYHIIFNVYKEEIVAATKAGTSKEAIGLKVFGEYELPYYDISLQQKVRDEFGVAEFLKNKLIKEYKFQLTQLENLNQAILQEAVQGKLVQQNTKDEPASELLKRIKAEKALSGKKEKPLPPIKPEDIPFEIPESWVWCRLGEIAYITSGSTPSKDAFVDEGIPFLKMYNLRNQEIDFHYKPQFIKQEVHNGQLKRCRAYPGDILMNIVGPPLGKIAIIPNSLSECNFNQAAVLIRPYVKEMNYYINYFLNEMSEIKAIDTKGVAGQDNISVTQSQNIKIPFPSLSEQKRIVVEIEKQLAKTKQLKEHIIANQQATEQLLKALLHQAFEIEEIEVAKPKGKVIELKPTNVDYYRRTVLAAEIVWQLHKEPTLGHLKLQKLIYLCQKSADMQLPTNFLRQAMGPYDNRLMRSIDKQLKEKKWFEYKKEQVFKYQPLEKAGQHHNDFIKYFSAESESIQFIIDKFKTIKSDIVEIVATLYACMDNMLNENVIFSEALLFQRFYEWSEEKKKFSEKEVERVFSRMKETGIIPKGYNF